MEVEGGGKLVDRPGVRLVARLMRLHATSQISDNEMDEFLALEPHREFKMYLPGFAKSVEIDSAGLMEIGDGRMTQNQIADLLCVVSFDFRIFRVYYCGTFLLFSPVSMD